MYSKKWLANDNFATLVPLSEVVWQLHCCLFQWHHQCLLTALHKERERWLVSEYLPLMLLCTAVWEYSQVFELMAMMCSSTKCTDDYWMGDG